MSVGVIFRILLSCCAGCVVYPALYVNVICTGTDVHTHHGCRHRRSLRPVAASRRPLLDKKKGEGGKGALLYPASMVWEENCHFDEDGKG